MDAEPMPITIARMLVEEAHAVVMERERAERAAYAARAWRPRRTRR